MNLEYDMPPPARCRVDADCPEVAELALLGAAMPECVYAGMMNGLLGHALFARAIKTIALGLCKDILAAFILLYSSFDSRHKIYL